MMEYFVIIYTVLHYVAKISILMPHMCNSVVRNPIDLAIAFAVLFSIVVLKFTFTHPILLAYDYVFYVHKRYNDINIKLLILDTLFCVLLWTLDYDFQIVYILCCCFHAIYCWMYILNAFLSLTE